MTPEDHAVEAESLLAYARDEYQHGDDTDRAEAALVVARAQVHATLATVRPTPPSPDLVDAALYYEAEREREVAVGRARELQAQIHEVEEALHQYGHWHLSDDILSAVRRLMERVYNDLPEPQDPAEPDAQALRNALEAARNDKIDGFRKMAHMIADITSDVRREQWTRRLADTFGRDIRTARREVNQWVDRQTDD